MNELFDIAGKTALVTGGVNGLGRMISEGLLRAGAKVIVTSRKSDPSAEEALQALGEVTILNADLNSAEGAVALANAVKGRLKSLNILVNNAGKTWGAPIESFPDKAWPEVMTVNVQSPFTLVRELLPLLEAAASPDDPARIINIGSVAAVVVEPLSAFSYASSKAAIHQLTRVLATELAARNITVNVLGPGFFPTRMTAHIRRDEEKMDELRARIPMHRLGEPDDIAGLCVFLSSRAGRYITGSELFPDGGLTNCR